MMYCTWANMEYGTENAVMGPVLGWGIMTRQRDGPRLVGMWICKPVIEIENLKGQFMKFSELQCLVNLE